MLANFYKYRFVLTGGGTGGHIMPLVAMHGYLQEYPVEILYIGESGGREQAIAKENKINFQGILAGKWRRYLNIEAVLDNILDLFKMLIGFLQALYCLWGFRPNAILSKGGYVSLPVVLAGAFLKIPILVHESDIEMGLTNKTAARYAKIVATGFPVSNYKKLSENAEMIYSGIPIDRAFFDAMPRKEDYEYFGFDNKTPILLITGGIQGAHIINDAIRKNLPKLLKDWQIIHLCGEGDYSDLYHERKKLGDLADRYAFFSYLGDERVGAMRIADLVISRASATTLAELASIGKPIVLIPLSTAAADHQSKNAKIFEDEGAALVINEKDLTPETLYETIEALREDKGRLGAMAKSLAKFSKPEAGKLLVEKLIQIIHE